MTSNVTERSVKLAAESIDIIHHVAMQGICSSK